MKIPAFLSTSRAGRQFFYLSNEGLRVWHRGPGGLEAGPAFANGEEGVHAFSEWLASVTETPACILADVIEEDFARETMPHVFGRARTNMIERRLAQVYRDTPFRRATPQGREPGGRRDDRLLLSALMNPDALKPWLSAFAASKVPVAGFYSLPLLVPALHARLPVRDAHVLLVLHTAAGLRQVYLHQGTMLLSRLAPLADSTNSAIVASIEQEVARTRQFLASTRLLARDAGAAVVIVAGAATCTALQSALADTDLSKHYFVSTDEAAHALRLREVPRDGHCETLFLQQLLQRQLPAHYVVSELKTLFRLWQARVALAGMTGAVALGGLLWTAANLYHAWDDRIQTLQQRQEARAAEARYAEINRSLPPTEAHPHDMKAAVSLGDTIVANGSDPREVLQAIGAALEKREELRIDSVRWHTSATAPADDSADAVDAAGSSPPQTDVASDAPPQAAALGVPAGLYQIVKVDGEVLVGGQEYRRAIQAVEGLAAALSGTGGWQAKISRLPLETRPTQRIDGYAAGKEDKERSMAFSIVLTRRPRHGD